MATLILNFSSNNAYNVTLKPYRKDYFEGKVAEMNSLLFLRNKEIPGTF